MMQQDESEQTEEMIIENSIYCFGQVPGLAETEKQVNQPSTTVFLLNNWRTEDIVENIIERKRLRGTINQKSIDPLDKYRSKIEQKQYHIESVPTKVTSWFEHIQEFDTENILKISSVYRHTLLLLKNGELYTFGEGAFGKLGSGELSLQLTPVKVLEKVSDISTGLNHSAAIAEHKLYTWGSGEYGQTGHGTVDYTLTPKVVSYFEKNSITPVQVVCGEKHTIVLASNWLVYGFGLAAYGQLGILSHLKLYNPSPEFEAQLLFQWSPKVVKAQERILDTSDKFKVLKVRRDFIKTCSVSCGQNFTSMLTTDGRLYFCGENICGAGGQGHTVSKMYKVEQCRFEEPKTKHKQVVGVDLNLTADKDKNEIRVTTCLKMITMEESDQKEDKVPQIVQSDSGWGHILCLDNCGILYGSGHNLQGQLGLGDRFARTKLTKITLPKLLRRSGVKQLACGGQFSALLSNDGFVYMMGAIPGSAKYVLKPTLLPQFQNVKYLSCGIKRMFLVT